MAENPFLRLEERRRKREAERMQLNKRLSELNAEGERDDATKRGLLDLYPNGFPEGDAEPVQGPQPGAPATPMFSLGNGPSQASRKPTASEMALEVVKDAYPQGLTQKQIAGKIYLRYRSDVSEHTARVSMIRHRVRSKARYDDGAWFYIPYEQRQAYQEQQQALQEQQQALQEQQQALSANGAVGNGQVLHEKDPL